MPTAARTRPAFTLIEILVVIVIILALLGILVASVGQFVGLGSRAAGNVLLGTVQTALTSYKEDCRDFPQSNNAGSIGSISVAGWDGGEILTQALAGPRNDDGQQGFGFKSGLVGYGPYITSVHTSNVVVSIGTAPNARFKFTLPDSAGRKAVLYYRANPAGAITATINDANTGIFSSAGRFDTDHNNQGGNSSLDGADVPNSFWQNAGAAGKATVDSRNGFAATLRTAKYLLVLPGVDDKYGTEDDLYAIGGD